MHHIVLERWSRGASPLHRRDARAKMVALAVFLVALATAWRALPAFSLGIFAMLCGALLWARIPLGAALSRAAIVLPFTAVFAVISLATGDYQRGAAIVLKSYLSALAVLTVVATTPLPALLRGLERMGAPLFLLTVAQFLYRYLFVISEEAQHMRKAALARGSGRRMAARAVRFRAAAGALAVLFARSYGRAQEIHRAMLARGFSGHLHGLSTARFTAADAVFLAAATAAPLLLRLALEKAAA